MVIQISNQQTPSKQKLSDSPILFLELAVPVFSFGGAFLALLFSGMSSSLDPRFF
jgi:hypothetical protein